MWKVFTARYALSPYIKQIRFVFKGLKYVTTFTYHIFPDPRLMLTIQWVNIRSFTPIFSALEIVCIITL
jgi:hypothetical protein